MNGYMIITNNPMVRDKLGETHNVVYQEISYEDILKDVRDRSVKPNETPYKSIMVSEKKGAVDAQGLAIIENAIQACGKFAFRSDKYKPEVYGDFQLIDLTLIESGITSADTQMWSEH